MAKYLKEILQGKFGSVGQSDARCTKTNWCEMFYNAFLGLLWYLNRIVLLIVSNTWKKTNQSRLLYNNSSKAKII